MVEGELLDPCREIWLVKALNIYMCLVFATITTLLCVLDLLAVCLIRVISVYLSYLLVMV